MTDDSGRSRPGNQHFFSADDDLGDELLVLDFSSTRLELVGQQPERQRRARGFDPYNTVEKPPQKQPWLRVERR
jgi:hypothetical protein